MSRNGMMMLENRVVVLTGGAAGMGETISCVLAEAGATVIIADRNGPAAESTAARIRETGGKAGASELDSLGRSTRTLRDQGLGAPDPSQQPVVIGLLRAHERGAGLCHGRGRVAEVLAGVREK